MNNQKKRNIFRSFRSQLILALSMIAIIPVLIIQTYSFYQTTEIIENNTNELLEANMVSMLQSVTLSIDAYQSILDQMYVDDALVALVNKLNAGKEIALSTNQLIRMLRTACYAKEYIQGITIVLQNGQMVFFDKMTGSTIRNSWMIQDRIEPQALYDKYNKDNSSHLLRAQYATQFNKEEFYLFHIARRIINFKDIEQKPGVVILSLDERILSETINDAKSDVGPSFLLGPNNEVISSPDSTVIGQTLADPLNECIQMAAEQQGIKADHMKAYERFDEKLNWMLVHVVDQNEMIKRIADQQRIMVVVLVITIMLLIAVIALVTGRLSGYIQTVANAMHRAGGGDMQVRVVQDDKMPTEVAVIADRFNLMMGDIDQLIQQVTAVSQKQRDAEIAMLEAQINPHFLYNTLDSINWMAIDENQMEISGAIAALARILRYSIDGSNRMVKLSEEAVWLEQYLFLQQVRLKGDFEYTLNIDPAAMDTPIHKLLFQPIVENAIRHGFGGLKREKKLLIEIRLCDEYLSIRINDNGCGMDDEQLKKIKQAIKEQTKQLDSIGILNAVSRMRMYYGDQIDIQVWSKLDEGTDVILHIPITSSEE
ncbi:MAG: histidine kinase [Clostridiales bacterium]|nr:histidine kinase [Clostridiales bacterium]